MSAVFFFTGFVDFKTGTGSGMDELLLSSWCLAAQSISGRTDAARDFLLSELVVLFAPGSDFIRGGVGLLKRGIKDILLVSGKLYVLFRFRSRFSILTGAWIDGRVYFPFLGSIIIQLERKSIENQFSKTKATLRPVRPE